MARGAGLDDSGARAFGVERLPITCFSDVLCVWAFFAELRLAAVRRAFGGKVALEHRFCAVFGDVPGKIAVSWASRGGYEGFGDHLQHSARAFPEVTLHPDVWRRARPASSLSPHLFLKAVALAEKEGVFAAGAFERGLAAMREAFFVRGLDVARRDVQHDVARGFGLDPALVQAFLDDGRAHAALSADYKDAETLGVRGSPTLILNEGRQKLFGNVGYRIIEANILELLRGPHPDQASWC
ncbi:DsbA family protein [Rhodoblastus acidophilus]|nr:DsbA family protein [Rhodoblastus acidophilus]